MAAAGGACSNGTGERGVGTVGAPYLLSFPGQCSDEVSISGGGTP